MRSLTSKKDLPNFQQSNSDILAGGIYCNCNTNYKEFSANMINSLSGNILTTNQKNNNNNHNIYT
jgi:hypothetical protein